MTKRQTGRPPLRVDTLAASRLLSLLQDAYRVEGEPGVKAVAEASKVSYSTAHKWLSATGTTTQFKSLEDMLGVLGYEFRVVKVRESSLVKRAGGSPG